MQTELQRILALQAEAKFERLRIRDRRIAAAIALACLAAVIGVIGRAQGAW